MHRSRSRTRSAQNTKRQFQQINHGKGDTSSHVLGAIQSSHIISAPNSRRISNTVHTRKLSTASHNRPSSSIHQRNTVSHSLFLRETNASPSEAFNTLSKTKHSPHRRMSSTASTNTQAPIDSGQPSPVATVHVPTRFENPDGPKLGMLRSAKVFLEEKKEYKYCTCGKSTDGVCSRPISLVFIGVLHSPLLLFLPFVPLYLTCPCGSIFILPYLSRFSVMVNPIRVLHLSH